MNTTSSRLPICVHCGTPRPADETLCPTCGKPWIDTTIPPVAPSGTVPPPVDSAPKTESGADEESDTPPVGAAVAGAAVVGRAASENTDGDEPEDETGDVLPDHTPMAVPPPPVVRQPDDTGEFAFDAWTEPAEGDYEKSRTAWLVPAGLVIVILAAVAWLVFAGDDSPSTTTVAALSSTTVSETTTSAAATTTTQAPTTTAIVFPLPGDWPPQGEPIDTADLTLKQTAIGPIDIGTPIGDVAGVLTSSLGEATASGIDGLCPPDEAYWLEFGQLTAVFDGFDSDAVFVSYRYDEAQGTDPDLGLQTLSGIAIGDTVEDLINTYTQFTISFEIIDSRDFFRLSDGGDLLLWGPVSSVDPAGLIEGIYSPTACDTAP